MIFHFTGNDNCFLFIEVTVEKGAFHYLFDDRPSLEDALQSLAGNSDQKV